MPRLVEQHRGEEGRGPAGERAADQHGKRPNQVNGVLERGQERHVQGEGGGRRSAGKDKSDPQRAAGLGITRDRSAEYRANPRHYLNYINAFSRKNAVWPELAAGTIRTST